MYKFGTFIETSGLVKIVGSFLMKAKAFGSTGVQIIQAQPILMISTSTVRTIFFYGIGMIAS